MFEEIRILYNDSLFPTGSSGSSVRTLNIGMMCNELFRKTTIFSIDDYQTFCGKIKDINIIQENKFNNIIDKYVYYFNKYMNNNFIIKYSDKAFDNIKKDVIFQITGPYYNQLLKKKGINNYILDEHNIYWEIYNFPQYKISEMIYKKIAAKRDKSNEIDSIINASHILVCSEIDRLKMIDSIPEAKDKVTTIPNCVDFDSFDKFCSTNKWEKYNEIINILFVGTYSYAPNVDAVNSICNIIAPKLDKNYRFIIVGKSPPKIKFPSNVEFTGYVDDVKPYILKSDICIAPIRYGSGTRLKILEYMAMGKPVISTYKGAEGIEYNINSNIIIENDIEQFSNRIYDLANDIKLINRISTNAKDLIQNKYDWKIYVNTLCNIYNNIY